MPNEYSMDVDWIEEHENWTNHGASLMYEKALEKLKECKHGNKDNDYCEECECYPEDTESNNAPLMNYAYPLYGIPSDEQIIKICEETNLTVMENNNTGDYWLALTGGGMDLSQDIGLAYIYAGERIPTAMAFNISTQYGLTVSGERWFTLMKEIQEVLKCDIHNMKAHVDRVEDAIKRAKEKK